MTDVLADYAERACGRDRLALAHRLCGRGPRDVLGRPHGRQRQPRDLPGLCDGPASAQRRHGAARAGRPARRHQPRPPRRPADARCRRAPARAAGSEGPLADAPGSGRPAAGRSPGAEGAAAPAAVHPARPVHGPAQRGAAVAALGSGRPRGRAHQFQPARAPADQQAPAACADRAAAFAAPSPCPPSRNRARPRHQPRRRPPRRHQKGLCGGLRPCRAGRRLAPHAQAHGRDVADAAGRRRCGRRPASSA